MATKKSHHAKYRGLKGIWTRYTEPNEDTGKSYSENVKDGTKLTAGIAGLAGGAMFVLGTGLGSIELVGDFDAQQLRGELLDEDFRADHEVTGIKTPDGHNVYLVQDEDTWRLYQVSEGDSFNYDLRYVEDSAEALRILTSVQSELQQEYNALSGGGYAETSVFYELFNVSGVHREDGEVHRYSTSDRKWVNGGNVDEVYQNVLDPLAESIDQISDTGDNIEYGFGYDSTPINNIKDDPYIDVSDVVAVTVYSFPLALLAGLGTLPLGIGVHVGEEYGRRRRAKKIRKNDKANKKTPKPS